jgi:NAD(P)-dependent dehydrogenase (short-subunit alcohol dehydrogenase family)
VASAVVIVVTRLSLVNVRPVRRQDVPVLVDDRGHVWWPASTGSTASSVVGMSSASKAAVSNFVRSLALDWGPAGVRLNAVAPALTRTGAVAAVTEDPDLLAKFVDRVALGRIGEPEDIAPAVLFLASDAARYVTGTILPVDGGTGASTGQARP